MKHSIAPGIHNVAHRRNLRKREVGSKSERSRAGEREENGGEEGRGEGGGEKETKSERRKEGMEKVGDHFFFVGKREGRAPGRKRTHELIMATCIFSSPPRFFSLGSNRFARPAREAKYESDICSFLHRPAARSLNGRGNATWLPVSRSITWKNTRCDGRDSRKWHTYEHELSYDPRKPKVALFI